MRLAWGLALVSSVAFAQVTPEHELEVVRSMFNAGNYKLALDRAQDAMAMANFSDAQRVELQKYAGISAFNLGDAPQAERHFLQLLQINPDYVLDPFAVAPPAIKVFEDVKRRNSDALNLIRQNIALREEQARREEAERVRRKQLEDAEKDRLQALAASQQVQRVVEKRPFLMNFVPFGAGQFLQGRIEWGIVFAVTEAVMGAVSIISFFALESLFEDITVVRHDTYDSKTGKFGDFTYQVHKIPEARANESTGWSTLKWTSGIIFYVVAAAGIFDAIWHHKPDVVTSGPAAEPKTPGVSFSLAPMPGGAAGGLTVHF